MKLLLTVTSARLAYGGPAVSVTGLASAMFSLGHDVGVWCPDGSAESSSAEYLRLTGSLQEATEAFGRPDLLHDSGIWMPHNHAIALFATKFRIPRVVSPRGMLSPWALRHKRAKKALAWMLYQRRDLESASCIHTTSADEACDVAALRLRAPIEILPNGLPAAAFAVAGTQLAPVSTANRNALFLGRIYPVKGLPILLESWNKVRPEGWRLKIVGPDEAGHRRELETQAQALRITESVEFHDRAEGDAKWRLLRDAKLFVLPSLSESFGMSVAEALAAGVPTITTTAAPWSALQDENLGWWVPPTTDGLASALRDATEMDRHELASIGRRGAEYARRLFSWSELGPQYQTLYQAILNTSNP